MGKVFLIVSGKGGVGKSTMATLLGYAAAKNSVRTLLIDGTIGFRSLDIFLGMEDRIMYDMFDCLEERCTIDEAVYFCDAQEGLHLMEVGQGSFSCEFVSTKLIPFFETLKKQYDMIFVDCATGVGEAFNAFALCSDEAVIVSTPDPVSIRSTEKIASVLHTKYRLPSNLLFNRTVVQKGLDGKLLATSQAMDIVYLGQLSNSPLLYEQAIEKGCLVDCLAEEPLLSFGKKLLSKLWGEEINEVQKPFLKTILNRLKGLRNHD